VFEVLEHTADIGFRAWGATVEELFANSAAAMESIAVEMAAVEERTSFPIAATGEDYESLLVNWLNEVLYHMDGNQVLLARFEIHELTAQRIAATGWGEVRDPDRHPPKLVVKGVTYHLLEVKQDQGRWTAQVILDI